METAEWLGIPAALGISVIAGMASTVPNTTSTSSLLCRQTGASNRLGMMTDVASNQHDDKHSSVKHDLLDTHQEHFRQFLSCWRKTEQASLPARTS